MQLALLHVLDLGCPGSAHTAHNTLNPTHQVHENVLYKWRRLGSRWRYSAGMYVGQWWTTIAYLCAAKSSSCTTRDHSRSPPQFQPITMCWWFVQKTTNLSRKHVGHENNNPWFCKDIWVYNEHALQQEHHKRKWWLMVISVHKTAFWKHGDPRQLVPDTRNYKCGYGSSFFRGVL